jgi:hypothetical protein
MTANETLIMIAESFGYALDTIKQRNDHILDQLGCAVN